MVLDNEAVQALVELTHPKHRAVLAHVEAVVTSRKRGSATRLLVPTSVRVEAGWDRTRAEAAVINRVRIADHGALTHAGERCRRPPRGGRAGGRCHGFGGGAHERSRGRSRGICTCLAPDRARLAPRRSRPGAARLARTRAPTRAMLRCVARVTVAPFPGCHQAWPTRLLTVGHDAPCTVNARCCERERFATVFR